MDILTDNDETKSEYYSINGIMQFLKNELMKNDIIKAQWNVERAELQARIAFLQGERKGQENLKWDLIRRVKMLEFALQQEDKKLRQLRIQKLSLSNDSMEGSSISTVIEAHDDNIETPTNNDISQFDRKDIRQFLNDNGYKDMMSEIRENRVKQLLGLTNDHKSTFDDADRKVSRRISGHLFQHLDQNFPTQIDISQEIGFKQNNYKCENFDTNDDSPIYDTVDDSSTFDDKYLLQNSNSFNGLPLPVGKISHSDNVTGVSSTDNASALGELACLTIANESVDLEVSTELRNANQKHTSHVSWTSKFSLRSHFDSVRCVGFHETKPLLVTGSEDRCLKLWNLSKTGHSKKSSNWDMEPVYTFRGHRYPVLSLLVQDETIFSSDLSGEIKIWKVPLPRVDMYDQFESNNLSLTTLQHNDAIWSLNFQKETGILLSSSADGTVNFWNTNHLNNKPVNTLNIQNTKISSSCFVPSKNDVVIVGSRKGDLRMINVETGQVISNFDYEDESHIYKVLVHPFHSLIITAHEDRTIRMFDITSGQMTSSLVAHLDAVTCIAVEHKSGSNHLLSGSHDCSIRLWDISSHACIQETTSHRKKFDESIYDIAVHNSLQYFASAGADGVTKVYS